MVRAVLYALEAVPSSSALGTALRFPLGLLPRSAVVPILTGQLRGYRWTAGAGNKSCILGTFGVPKQSLLCSLVTPGATVIDVGAHSGFYTLLLSRLVGPQGKVLAFEPLPGNLRYLNDHIRLNEISNVTVHDAAVGEAPGTARFQPGMNSYTGALSPDGSLDVSVVSLDDLRDGGAMPKADLIKIDVEGGEHQVLQGARRLIREAQPVLIIATHSERAEHDCVRLLDLLDYSLTPIEPDPGGGPEFIARPAQSHHDRARASE
jgi:FkbM family methyltransferase